MPIGEFTKYGLVFGSSLIGGVSGYFYSSRPINLRMRLERNGTKVLRSSDPLWMYERLVKRYKTEIKELFDETKSGQQTESTVQTITVNSNNEPTDSELALKLLNWCDEKLTDPKWKNFSKETIIKYCEFPNWM